jgi:hypothetical protein
MYIDYAVMIYEQCSCQNNVFFLIDFYESKIEYWIFYKVFSLIPNAFLSSYLLMILTFRLIAKKKVSIIDDSEKVFSYSDIIYVLELFLGNKDTDNKSNCRNIRIFSKMFRKISNIDEECELTENTVLEHPPELSKKERFKKKLKYYFKNYIYEWQDSFRFSSRFLNMHVVALLTLYHISLLLLYFIIAISAKFVYLENILKKLGINIPFDFALIPSLVSLLIVPFIGSIFICLIQILIGLRETKIHLLELYKGNCSYLPNSKGVSNSTIASSSFHFGGYLTGYLIWGFFIQYFIIVLIGFILIVLEILVRNIFVKILLILIPSISAFIFRQLIEFFGSEIIFLKRNTKILAIDNFRAFNVFLYFNFFFDCFIGIVSAIMRLLIAFIAAIFMMPRIAYSFMGRHLEKLDYGYSAYMGFLYMVLFSFFLISLFIMI